MCYLVQPEMPHSDWSILRYWLLHIKTCNSQKIFTSSPGHFLFIGRIEWILIFVQGQYSERNLFTRFYFHGDVTLHANCFGILNWSIYFSSLSIGKKLKVIGYFFYSPPPTLIQNVGDQLRRIISLVRN